MGHCESRGRDGWQLRGLGGQMLVFKLRRMTRQRRHESSGEMGWGGWARIGPRWPQAGAGMGGRILRKGPAF